MKNKYFGIFLVIFFLIILKACSVKPGPNLASKASLIHPNFTTKIEVLQILGPPFQAFSKFDGTEEWYYYYLVRSPTKKVPLVKRYLGEEYTEVLKIVFKENLVLNCTYYTIQPKR
ncbi:MAG: outer membrane protein assembly factor BamE [Thermodesulfobacteriaceae bacterium]|nr:outer membrane protein assembly factor BamE [Thermodesulfobacteriaceae bacterium]MDW8135734.1 outer membrane protein assembly factor BamE [Thermodesulfobacterium sp.]